MHTRQDEARTDEAPGGADAIWSRRYFETGLRRTGSEAGRAARFRIRGLRSGAPVAQSQMVRRILEHVRQKGISLAPGKRTLQASFRDGGLRIDEGLPGVRARGAWIDGEGAAAWVAHGLGLRPAAALRPSRIPEPTSALRAAYTQTDYMTLGGAELRLRIGEPIPGELVERMRENAVKTGAIITAWNPFSRALGAAENRLRQLQLLCDLRRQDIAWLDAKGRDAAGVWPPEASALAPQIRCAMPGAPKKNPAAGAAGFWCKALAMTYSRMREAHYHRRGCVSLPSSRWDRVVPQRYVHQGEGGGSRSDSGAGPESRAHALMGMGRNKVFLMSRCVIEESVRGPRLERSQNNLRLYDQAARIISTG